MYCGNNPLAYVDPTGLDTIYATQSKGVAGAGHTGYVVENYNDDGTKSGAWTYFEATPYNKNRIKKDEKEYSGIVDAKYLNKVKINIGRADDTLVGIDIGDKAPASAGLYEISFTSIEDLNKYLEGKGMDRRARIGTSGEEDRIIADFSRTGLLDYFNEYNFTDLNCSHVTAKALSQVSRLQPLMAKLFGWYPNQKFDILKSLAPDFGGIKTEQPPNLNWREGLLKTRDKIAFGYAVIESALQVWDPLSMRKGIDFANSLLRKANELNTRIESEGRAY